MMFCSGFQYVFVKPLEDAKKTTTIILEALRETGQRGIISRGWGDLGSCMYFPFLCNIHTHLKVSVGLFLLVRCSEFPILYY